ncbi:MAG: Gfo/Idh/MocA family oxidoreductase [Chloroflexia bacterium]|nr:Gfo/Idh/MocA family oxidoreductase [Chloroflexia bacterium]
MIRIGLVGVNTSHADAFSRIFNGSADEAPRLESGKVVSIWGGDPERVATLAANHWIETTVSDPAEMIGAVDAVLIVDDTGGGALHDELARPFLMAGLPVFVDKPMTTAYPDAVALFDLAEAHSAPLLSCSALRFAVEIEAAKNGLAAVGTLSSIVSVGPGDWFYYGVHAVELLGVVAGTGASWVHRHALPNKDITVIGYEDGPAAVVETLRDAAYVFHLTAFGADGFTSVHVQDAMGFYTNTMRAFATMAETGVAPLHREQTLEVIAILEAGNRSAERGERVELMEIRKG